MVRQGGILTLDDLKNYRAIHCPVISTNYHGYKAFTTSALTSGPVVLNVLNLVKPYNFSMKGPTRLNYHRLIEALKFGYAGRTEIRDPLYTGNQDRLDELITKEWADSIRSGITDVSIISLYIKIFIAYIRTQPIRYLTTIQNLKIITPMALCIYQYR